MQIYINDLDGRTRTLDVDHETTAADVCGGGRLLHGGRIVTGSLRDANVQRDATLTVVEPVRGGMPDREYNSSDEDSVTTDSNEGKEDDEDSSDYSSSDDETTLPQVTTLESVLAMIPFTPDWREAASNFKLCFNSGCFSRNTVAWVARRSCPSFAAHESISTQVGGARGQRGPAQPPEDGRRDQQSETSREALRGGHARRRAARAAPRFSARFY